MSLKYFTRRAAIEAATTSPFLTNFNHLNTIPKAWWRQRSVAENKLKSVRPKDRIRCWNIVPGDQIRIRGDKTNTLHEVLSINRLSNRVFVKGAANASNSDTRIAQNKNFHYSRCQLFVGNYEFPADDGLGKKVVPVFAQRVSATKPRWSILAGRFAWTRFATKTFPKVPWQTNDIVIPWPSVDRPSLPSPSSYDTPHEVVAEVTYKPPQFQHTLQGLPPRPPSEQDFLATLYNPNLNLSIGDALPLEVFLKKELSNPHSKAKKLQRWKIRKSNEHARMQELVAQELKDLNGRTERDARAEAAFRWREELKQAKEEQKKMRWKHKAADIDMLRKARKKMKKEERHRRKLTELTLEDAPNQVIPKTI